MKAIAVLCLFVSLACADQAKKQRDVLRLLSGINEKSENPYVVKTANEYNPSDHPANYEDPSLVEKFLKHYHDGHHRDRDDYFNLFDAKQRKEAVALFEIFMGCKNYDAFYQTASWARQHVNQYVFLYSYTVALLNREDCKGLHIPPMYEINPHFFTTTNVIQEAYSAKMKQTPKVIDMKFTGTQVNPEQWVAYFGEDVGLNNHHFHWHADFPFWWKKEYKAQKDRKGELFFYAHHQLTARFDHERRSNWLPEVEPLSWDKPITEGFQPFTTYRKEGEFPFRPDNMRFHDLPRLNLKITDMKNWEHRLKDAIKLGYLIDNQGNPVSINSTQGINYLAEALEASASTKNAPYYGSLHNLAHVMLSRVSDPKGKYGLPPGVMEHFETATRDPSFFRLHKYIDNIFKEHKNELPPYTRQELIFPGVEIQNVVVTGGSHHDNVLETFFEKFEFDISNALDHSKKVADISVKARVDRLNHNPFSYNIRVHSDADKVGIVRIFLAPLYNYYNLEYTTNEARWLMVELDRFTTKLHQGNNNIIRKSTKSSATIDDPLSFKEIANRLEAGTLQFDDHHRHCGHPQRLLLPRGDSGGLDFQLVVMITDFEQDKAYDHDHDAVIENSLSYCGTLHEKYPDSKPMGFPFDRRIDEEMPDLPNMFTQYITIKHLEDHV